MSLSCTKEVTAQKSTSGKLDCYMSLSRRVISKCELLECLGSRVCKEIKALAKNFVSQISKVMTSKTVIHPVN